MDIKKSSNVNEAIVGDIITYKLVVTNDDSFDYINVLVKDLLSPDLDFVEGSVAVDGIPKTSASILTGIDLGPLPQLGSTIVTFQAKIVSKSGATVDNQSTVYYTHLGPTGQTVIATATSNINSIAVSNAELTVTKTADQVIACLGSTITYSVIVENTGDLDAYSVSFKDYLPECLAFVPTSFTLNGVLVNDVNLTQGLDLGTMLPGDRFTISYQVKLGTCMGQVCNQAFVEFEYVQPNGVTGSKTSNVASACIESRVSFKQLMLDKYCEVPCVKPNIEDLNDEVSVDIEIVNSYAIQTLKATSTSGQNLTGYKLIVHGNICISIEYTAALETQPVHSYHCTLPFGTFIILPSDYQPGQQVEVNAIIENVEADMVSCRGVFTNITLLLVARIR